MVSVQSCMMLRSSNLGASKTSYQSFAYAAAVACAMLPTLIKQYNSESSKQAMRDFRPRNRVTPPAYFNLVIFHVRLLLKSLVKIISYHHVPVPKSLNSSVGKLQEKKERTYVSNLAIKFGMDKFARIELDIFAQSRFQHAQILSVVTSH